jgi:hypothetical protein
MLTLTPTEVRVLHVWAERGINSPFPQEATLAGRVRANSANRELKLTVKELTIVLHWAEQETKGHHGTDQYLLEQEEKLLTKIETFIEDTEDKSFG